MRNRQLAVFIDLIQDVDVLLPVILDAREDGRFQVSVLVSRWLAKASPRTQRLLEGHQLPFRYLSRRAVTAGRCPLRLRGYDALLTAAESTCDTHAAARMLTERMRRAGAITFTLQHGFENVGLKREASGDFARFASDWVFIWTPTELQAPDLPDETQGKLIQVQRPSLPPSLLKTPMQWDVAIFENLHAEHYSEADRQAFLASLSVLLIEAPELRVQVRPHPAGGWLSARASDLPPAVRASIMTPERVREDLASGRAIAAAAVRVITTPSTIAFDAACLGKPVAIVAGLSVTWEPLPILHTPNDWLSFAHAPPDTTASTAFCDRFGRGSDANAHLLSELASRLAT